MGAIGQGKKKLDRKILLCYTDKELILFVRPVN